jgi:hypothetical protein
MRKEFNNAIIEIRKRLPPEIRDWLSGRGIVFTPGGQFFLPTGSGKRAEAWRSLCLKALDPDWAVARRCAVVALVAPDMAGDLLGLRKIYKVAEKTEKNVSLHEICAWLTDTSSATYGNVLRATLQWKKRFLQVLAGTEETIPPLRASGPLKRLPVEKVLPVGGIWLPAHPESIGAVIVNSSESEDLILDELGAEMVASTIKAGGYILWIRGQGEKPRPAWYEKLIPPKSDEAADTGSKSQFEEMPESVMVDSAVNGPSATGLRWTLVRPLRKISSEPGPDIASEVFIEESPGSPNTENSAIHVLSRMLRHYCPKRQWILALSPTPEDLEPIRAAAYLADLKLRWLANS